MSTGPGTMTRSPTWLRRRSRKTSGRISAKRLLPAARAAGYVGSPRNFRRVVAEAKQAWRQGQVRGSSAGGVDAGGDAGHRLGRRESAGGVHVFCAVLAWSRFRFVRFADDEKASTTLAMLAECFEVLGGVPRVVLADRMGCLKGGVVANVVVPTPDYVRFASHYRFRPDYCQAADPESKGIVENLVGYAKADLMIPSATTTRGRARVWAVAGQRGSARVVRGGQRLSSIRRSARSPTSVWPPKGELLGDLPPLPPGDRPPNRPGRKVDKLSCIRFASARYSVPNGLIGQDGDGAGRRTRAPAACGRASSPAKFTPNRLVAPGRPPSLMSTTEDPAPRPDERHDHAGEQRRGSWESGPVAEAFLTGAATAGVTKLSTRDQRDPHPGRATAPSSPAHSPRAGRELQPVAGS